MHGFNSIHGGLTIFSYSQICLSTPFLCLPPYFRPSNLCLGKGNHCALLVGKLIGVATVENSMEVPQKTKNRTTMWFSHSTPGHISEENENINSKGYMHPMFIEALFTKAGMWRQPGCPSMDEWIKKI